MPDQEKFKQGTVEDLNALKKELIQKAVQEKKGAVVGGGGIEEGQINETEKKETDEALDKLIIEIYEKGRDGYLKSLQESVDYYKKEGEQYNENSQQKLLDEMKALYEISETEGRQMMLQYMKENIDDNISEDERAGAIQKLVGIFHNKLNTLRILAVHHIRSEEGTAEILKRKGIEEKNINETDLRDLVYERFNEVMPLKSISILKTMILEEPKRVRAFINFQNQAKDFLRTEDWPTLEKIALSQLDDFVLEEFQKIAVNTPEREEYRIRSFLFHELHKHNKFARFWEKDEPELNNFVREINQERKCGLESDEDFAEAIARIKNYSSKFLEFEQELVKKLLEINQQSEREIVRKVDANFELADPEDFELQISRFVREEVEKILREVVADRKKETGFSPEQEEWVGILSESGQEYYDKILEILGDERKNHTDEGILSGFILPHLRGIYDDQMLGERGFTNDTKEQVVQRAAREINLSDLNKL